MILPGCIYPKESIKPIFYELQKRNGKGFITFMDINNMKDINDIYGHLKGDYAIRRVCRLIVGFLNDQQKMVRFGGDEFVLFSSGISKEELKVQLEKIQTRIQNDEYLKAKFHQVSISMGTTEFSSEVTHDKALENADMLMYAAKNNAPTYIAWDADDQRIFEKDKRQKDILSARKRSYFSWIISVIKRENPEYHTKLLIQVCREVFVINGMRLLSSGTPNSAILTVKEAYDNKIKKLLEFKNGKEKEPCVILKERI